MEPRKLSWSLMLGLLAVSASACSTKTTTHGTGSGTEHPEGHPCRGKSNCDFYQRLPDGGVAPPGSDAGQLTICGPCNG